MATRNIYSLAKISMGTLLCTAALTPFSVAANAQSNSSTLTIDHLLQMQTPSDVQIDPSGEWVAYTVRRMDEDEDKGRSQIWMSSVDGKTSLPLTADYTNASSPRWSPDGKTLAFTGVRGAKDDLDDAKSQVWLLDRRGGEAQKYTNVEQGVDDFAWAPDGKSMVLTITDPEPEEKDEDGETIDADKPKPWVIDRLQFKQDYVGYLDRKRTHLYLFDGENDPVQITSGDYDDDDPQWSPDGTKIAFVSKRDGDPDANTNSDIWVVAADAKAKKHPLTQVTTNKGSDSNPAWSPDGNMITYTTIIEPEKLWYATEHLATINAKGGTAKLLTQEFDRMISSPSYSADGESIYFSADDGGNRPLMRLSVDNGDMEVVTPGDTAVRSYDIHKNGTIALTKSSHAAPYDVHVMNAGTTTQLSQLNDDVLDGVKLGDVQRLKVKGYNDDLVESFVYTPPNYKKGRSYPTIFVLHGGPVGQHDVSFDQWAQLYAANGYIAVLPNPHGSSGYGQPFTYSLNRQWGVPDFADVDAIADHMVANGMSKADQLGVGGWSYGGILTNYVITKSTRFAGAVTGASEVNHRANYGHDIYQNAWEVELGLPWEDIEAWESINPFNDLGNVTTPTLVIGGKEDWNVPIQNSEQLYQVLKRRGIETQLVVYPNEHHGIRRPSFVRDRYQRYLDWYKTYVKK